MPSPAAWLLSSDERANPASHLYADHDGGPAWSEGNRVEPLVDGANYFRRLCRVLRAVGRGDQVYFVDWRGDPDERLAEPGTAVMVELARAESAGAHVYGLVWRSHLDRFRFSEEENRNLAQALLSLNADVVLDMRVRRGGSHHQKFVVVRHHDDPTRDVAFVGGTDLSHSRRDDSVHAGDPQPQRMNPRYGATPPWHDAMVEIHGPAVADVECCFRERWEDPTAPRHARPWLWAMDKLRGVDGGRAALPTALPVPPPAGDAVVQLLRTYPPHSPPYPFAPRGERTVARGYVKAVTNARRLVYVEDQFLWDRDVARVFADALRRSPDLHFVAVVPRFSDAHSWWQEPAKQATHDDAIRTLREAGGDRVHVFDIENDDGTPIYVHAKVCIVDDVWACVGSANLNRRSWTHDSELSAAVVSTGEESFARRLRLRLWSEHLGVEPGALDPARGPEVLDEQAGRLDAWYAAGRTADRPAGRLRRHLPTPPRPVVRRAVRPLLRTVVDPDARPSASRGPGRW